MNDDHRHSGHFDAAMPLPDEVKIRHDDKPPTTTSDTSSQNPAADLVRMKVNEAYSNAPPAADEIQEVKQLGETTYRSKHQQFIVQLIDSGKPLPEIQTAWHEYYAGLPDAEKHQVWQEFYAVHAQTAHFANIDNKTTEPKALPPVHSPRTKYQSPYKEYVGRVAMDIRKRRASKPKRDKSQRPARPLHSLLFGLGMGSLVMLVFLFSFFNERFIAPFIQPSRAVTSTPIINDSTTIGRNPEIIIPKINVEIPVVYDVTTIDQNAVENALENGVVHYADTALPGQDGNGVIVGHSSNNIFNHGRYKFAFVLLSRLESGDTFYLQKDGVRYTYQVYKKAIVRPTDVSVLAPQDKPATFTLITCDPPGTSTNRLVVIGQQISPDPNANLAQSSSNTLATKAAIVPGNSPSLWSRLTKFLSH